MAWLPIYCVREDLPTLLSFIDDDLAFIVSDGPHEWRATREHAPAESSRIGLWHIPSGPLPHYEGGRRTHFIEDPCSGWTAEPHPNHLAAPYFGAGHPGVFWLNLRIPPQEKGSVCGLTSFEWIGNRYGRIGSPAPKATANRWAKLRRQISKVGKKVPRGDSDQDAPAEIWALPKAYDRLGTGDIWPL